MAVMFHQGLANRNLKVEFLIGQHSVNNSIAANSYHSQYHFQELTFRGALGRGYKQQYFECKWVPKRLKTTGLKQ